MSYIGDLVLGQTFDTKFTTVQSTGAPTTLSASPVISNYVGNNTTEITAGITLTVDFDSRTGLNNVHVVASGGNGYAATTDNQLVITTGTVNSVSVVGYVVAEFSTQNRFTNVIQINGTAQTAKDLGAINVTNLNTLSGHDPGATLGTSTLTQTQVTGGAYSVQSSSCVLGDARIANLDATVSSRTKPADTQAAVTTVTNLTNAPTVGDFTAAMKTSLNAATPAVTVSDKTGFSLTAAYDSAKTAASATDVATQLGLVGLTSSGVTIIAGVTLHLAGTGGQGIGG